MANLIVLLDRFPWWNWAPRCHSKLMPTWSIPCLSIANKFQNNSKSVTVEQRVYFDRLQQKGDHGEPDRITGPFPLVKLGSTMPLKLMSTWSIPCISIANNFQNNSKSVTVKQRVYFDRLQQQGDHGKKPDCITGPFPLVKLGSTLPLKIDAHLIHALFKHCKQLPK